MIPGSSTKTATQHNITSSFETHPYSLSSMLKPSELEMHVCHLRARDTKSGSQL